MARRPTWTPTFLEQMTLSPVVADATKAAGISRSAAYKYRQDHEDFAEDWDAAKETALDALEAEVRRRAVEGVEEGIYYKGERIDTVRRYSDNLLMFMLKKYRPEFREKFTISGDPDNPLHTVVLIGTERNLKAQAGLATGERARLSAPAPEPDGEGEPHGG